MIFKPVTLAWKGTEYEVPADKVMLLIAKVEDVITLSELLNPRGRPLAKISMAYGVALRHAGAKVRDEEIYASMFADGSADTAAAAVSGLLAMMLPPSSLEAPASKKAEPPEAATSS